MVRIRGFHPLDPGSNPGGGDVILEGIVVFNIKGKATPIRHLFMR